MTDPLFSILTPVYDPPLKVLAKTIESVVSQEFREWEWVIVDDCSQDSRVRDLLRTAAARHRRIKLIERADNGHIVKATNDALSRATGTFIALLDHDDVLTSDALARVSEVLAEDVDYVYTDEVFISANGEFVARFPKPDWSPERLRGQMYTGHLSVIRRALANRLGGFREGFDGSQDYDLVLRVAEAARRVVHVPLPLYQWRQVEGSVASSSEAKPYAYEAAERAIAEHLQRVGIDGEVVGIPGHRGHYHIRRRLDPQLRVSVIIPTAFQEGLVWGEKRTFVVEALQSLFRTTRHENLEIVIVHDGLPTSSVWAELVELCGGRLVGVQRSWPFNFSERVNAGVVASTGDRIVLLNDDVESAVEGWLEQLVAPLDDPKVGMTGSLLMFADGTIQHAGHGYEQGIHYHPYRDWPATEPGRMGDLIISHEVSGVTAAAAALRRETFYLVGGLCEELPNNYNDVDLSLKVAAQGLSNVYITTSRLYHFESKSRDPKVTKREKKFITDRWGVPTRDAFYPELLPES